MVRLEVLLPSISIRSFISFQFQYGAIRSTNAPLGPNTEPHFNSSMVRLEERSMPQSIVGITYFNSSMVRLEVIQPDFLRDNKQNFNSSMVRLEDFYPLSPFDPSYHFNSSMVRLEESRMNYNTSFQFISIPVWCD